MIQNVFDLDDTAADEICTHRRDVVVLYMEDSDEEWERIIRENRHTFYPVCGEDQDDIIHILDTRDYFRLDDLLSAVFCTGIHACQLDLPGNEGKTGLFCSSAG